MKLFVTGGTGFIGSHFLNAALKEGHEVVALRRSENSRPRIDLTRQPVWLTCSLADVTPSDFQQVDVLIHFAAVGVSPQKATWSELFQGNVLDSVALWETAADAGVSRFVICGSCFEYGASALRYMAIPPNAPLEPTNAYGASKAAASVAAMALGLEKNLAVSILRPFQVYGEGQHENNLWPSLKVAAQSGQDFSMTAGEQACDYVSVKHVAVAFLDECREMRQKAQTYVQNIGSGRPQLLRDFAAEWWKHWSASGQLKIGALPYRSNEVMRYIPQI